MHIDRLRDLWVFELRDLYDAEQQLTDALPKMAKAASSPDLKQAFEQHLEQTRGQVSRLEQIFDKLGEKPTGTVCHGMRGLVKEGEQVITGDFEPAARDAALISAAQRVEHYEIAGYGTVRTFAEFLNESSAANLLQQTLDEEGETDKKLTKLATDHINREAKA